MMLPCMRGAPPGVNPALTKEVVNGQKSINRAMVKGDEKIGVLTTEGQQPAASIWTNRSSW